MVPIKLYNCDNLCIDVNRTSVQRTRKAGYLNSKERLLEVLSWLALDRGGRWPERNRRAGNGSVIRLSTMCKITDVF